MIKERSSVYRGATREAAEGMYHADARVMAHMGYAPIFEEWSTAPGELVLTVGYLNAPERAPAVLRALAEVQAESARTPTPQPPPPVERSRPGLEAIRNRLKDAPEVLYDRPRRAEELISGGVPGIAAATAIGFLFGAIFDSMQIFMVVIVLGLVLAGLWIAMFARSTMMESRQAEPAGRPAGPFRTPIHTHNET